MAEDLSIISGTKTEQYESLIPQIRGLLEGETDLVANLANVVASLKEQFRWLWVGFYLVKMRKIERLSRPRHYEILLSLLLTCTMAILKLSKKS